MRFWTFISLIVASNALSENQQLVEEPGQFQIGDKVISDNDALNWLHDRISAKSGEMMAKLFRTIPDEIQSIIVLETKKRIDAAKAGTNGQPKEFANGDTLQLIEQFANHEFGPEVGQQYTRLFKEIFELVDFVVEKNVREAAAGSEKPSRRPTMSRNPYASFIQAMKEYFRGAFDKILDGVLVAEPLATGDITEEKIIHAARQLYERKNGTIEVTRENARRVAEIATIFFTEGKSLNDRRMIEVGLRQLTLHLLQTVDDIRAEDDKRGREEVMDSLTDVMYDLMQKKSLDNYPDIEYIMHSFANSFAEIVNTEEKRRFA